MGFFKKLLVVVVLVSIIGGVYFAYFLHSNKAPITQGEVVYGLEYKEGLPLDIYAPTKEFEGDRPVVIFFHGGAWFAGSKESINLNRYNEAVLNLREQGYYVISPEYTLASDEASPFPTCIQDAFDVMTWIKSNQEAYGFDLNNVGIFGESAGAHIGMMAAYADPDAFSKTRDLSPNYVVDVYGPTELNGIFHAQMIDSLKNLLKKLPKSLDFGRKIFGFDPDEDSLKTRSFLTEYSPTSFLSNDLPPTLLIHGDSDQVVPLDQSILLQGKLEDLGVENEFHILEGVNHAFIGAQKSQMDSVQTWITTFIVDHYRP